MVYAWQEWLSGARPARSMNAGSPEIAGIGNKVQFFVEEDGRHVVQETHFISEEVVRSGKSGPPLHIHLRQAEYFQVVQGVLGVVQNGKEVALTKEDGPVGIPAGVRHAFWCHESCSEDLIFKVWLTPENLDHGLDEKFMRNFDGYLVDCEKAKVAPSLFQLLLFLYDADIVLTPPFWVPLFFLKSVHHVLAHWVGHRLLGYQTSYPEYYVASKKAS